MTSTAPRSGVTQSYAKVLTALVAVSAYATLPFRTQYLSQFPGYRHPGPLIQALEFLVDIAISYAIIRAGLDLGRRVDLGWPPIEGWDGELSSPKRLRRAVVAALLLGTATALSIAIGGALFSANWHMRVMRRPTLEVMALASIGGGVYEEVWFRLGAMTVFVWMLTRLSAFADSRRTVVWSATALSAAVFGAAHLPQAKAMATLTPSLIAFVLVANGAIGLVCGWLYWRRGLFAAMLAHITVDLILKVGLPLVRLGVG